MPQAAAIEKPVITDIAAGDYEEWLPLWLGNNQGKCDDAVTAETWTRLITPIYPVHGLAVRAQGRMAGLVHYILHPVTGHIQPACYMQDLYIAPPHRRQGLGRALVEHLAAIGRREKWARLYWLADENNEAAQALYKNLGIKLSFSLHIMPLS